VGPFPGRDQSTVADLRGQFHRFEGVARGDRPALAAEHVVGPGAEVLADESGDSGGAERFEVEGALARTSGKAPESLRVVGEFVRPVGDDQQQRQFLGARREGGEPAQ
jgi:hypothetical protein